MLFKITVLLLLVIQHAAYAQDIIFACQETQASGFIWKNSRWNNVTFKAEDKFFIKIVNGKVEPQSLANALETKGDVTCQENILGLYTTCRNLSLSKTILFSMTSGTGSIARQIGSVISAKDNEKDSVSISLFTCQKM